MDMEDVVKSVMGGKFRRLVILTVFIIILLLAAILVTVTNIGGNEVGIVEKKFGGGSLAEGRIISVKGENGIQAQVLAPGWHFFYWPWQYTITKIQVIEIKDGQVGLVQAADGRSLCRPILFTPRSGTSRTRCSTASIFSARAKVIKGRSLRCSNPENTGLIPGCSPLPMHR